MCALAAPDASVDRRTHRGHDHQAERQSHENTGDFAPNAGHGEFPFRL